MAKPKSFTQTATAAFISTEKPQEEAKPEPIKKATPKKKPEVKTTSDAAAYEVPAGKRLAPELRNERLQLLISTRLKDGLKKAAELKGVSTNELINNIVSEYLEREGIK